MSNLKGSFILLNKFEIIGNVKSILIKYLPGLNFLILFLWAFPISFTNLFIETSSLSETRYTPDFDLFNVQI